ncbi:MAG TPA: carbon-nitrogen hydrolase [Methanoregulaceae archaeon]|nr:carbon-nitrogen hydrolase [Methanoregulaceae archaeon]HPD10905.1 carbon-nitrogen hydrolase [Methanoregulaceae archaeon]HRT16050.1 carbon-nitrogen hydrolase [Methanoregulaceae archaeon]HRU31556.1 carbon-nitrogen hydrolase [Methanoregulaceae archaeon]
MEPRRIRIGLIQQSVSENTGHNLKRAVSLAEQAAHDGAEIICLPELFRTPYFPQYERRDASAFAEPVDGESVQAFLSFTRKYQVTAIVPIFEQGTGGCFFNTAVVLHNGSILKPPYRKVHIPHDPLFFEKDYFSAGTGYAVYSTPIIRFGVLICYDQWFPEAARALTLLGAEIIFYPTAIGWIHGERDSPEGDWRTAWETVMRGHAIANGVHVAAVNRVGSEGDLVFWGSSFVTDAFGMVTARAGEAEEVLMAEIDPGMNTEVREGWGFLRNRRPDTYGILTSGE